MKIALVTDTYYPRINGVSASTRSFATEFVRLGHEVQIFAPAYPQSSKDTLCVHRFPSLYLFFDPEDRLGIPFWSRGLVHHFIEAQFDIVHTQTPFSLGSAAIHWARKSGALIVHTYHTLFTEYVAHYLPWFPQRITRASTRWFSRRYCNRCDMLVCPSTAMRRVLESYAISSPIQVIPTGIDLSNFIGHDGPRYRRQLGLLPENKVLLFMGRVAEEKNIDFLLRVVNRVRHRIPHLRLLIAGEGPAKARLQRMTAQLGLTECITFLGYLTKDDWRDCYAAADLFVFSSVTETQGLVVSEAMAVGTPVVAVGEMGIKDVMASGRGGIVTKFDESEFASAIQRLLLEPQLYQSKRSEALEEAGHWSATTMAKRMLANYQSMLSKNIHHLPMLGENPINP